MNSAKRIRLEYNNGDRFCNACGRIVKGMAREKTSTCPLNGCGGKVPFRDSGTVSTAGWGRCTGPLCDSLLNDSMLYCEHCGCANAVSFRKREQSLKADCMKEVGKAALEIKECKAREMEKERQLLIQQTRIEELEKLCKHQDEEISARKEFMEFEDDSLNAELSKAVDQVTQNRNDAEKDNVNS